MRDMPYSTLDVDKGVDGLRTMGVRYYMASTEDAIAQARAQPDLTMARVYDGPQAALELLAAQIGDLAELESLGTLETELLKF